MPRFASDSLSLSSCVPEVIGLPSRLFLSPPSEPDRFECDVDVALTCLAVLAIYVYFLMLLPV
jgi:hypothetical protein